MRIGIDIDETITETKESFYKIIKKYNIDYKDEYINWIHSDLYHEIVVHLDEMFIDLKLKEDVKEVLDYLSSEGHELIAITARSNYYSQNVIDITKKYILDNNLNISNIYFKQNKKSDIAKELKIDLMIDDSIDVYNNMKEEGIDCILFGDKIKTWKQVLEYIKAKEE